MEKTSNRTRFGSRRGSSRWTGPALLALLGAAASVLLPQRAAAKELHWKSLEVEARLESDGTLAISELQRMVFDGDWNGGEREFRLGLGQHITIDRIVRLDPSGAVAAELSLGSLDEVDRYAWAKSDTLRWRSRRPSDPEFAATELDYRLDYRLTGALQKVGDRTYVLNHDYAFAKRDGPIETFVARLSLAPEWQSRTQLPVSWEAGPLLPGAGFVVRTELDYSGAALPANAAPPHLDGNLRWAAVGLFLVGAFAFRFLIRRRDAALGRFDETAKPTIDGPWLEEKVFSMAPEVVGAAWDRSVGAAEVASTLARLTQEGKLKSDVTVSGRIFRKENLHLELLAARDSLSDYERKLIDALFGGATTTDTDSVRARYRSTGFDPASKIRAGVEARLQQVRGFAEGSPRPNWRPTGLLLLAGIIGLAGASVLLRSSATPGTALLSFFLPASLVLASIPGWIGAARGRKRVSGLTGPRIAMLLSTIFMAALVWGFSAWPGVHPLQLVAGVVFALGLARSHANLLATRESAESLVRRRELEAARDYLASELARPDPRLEDRWFPYLLAFGLAPKMDRWFRRFGAATAATGGSFTSMSGGGGSSSSGSGGWSGGGGAFGGAGASASWAMAATAMSSSVAAPSSSGSGGSGGGGSSGGGGGGGW
ncbi:MAG: hypothetical protein ABI639_08635 [Thermoanaerobaculia bacterium]